MFVDRELARHQAQSLNALAFNDNGLEEDLPTLHELLYLRRGLSQAGGKLPLFDLDGQSIDVAIVKKCLKRGWAQPWFNNPLKPDWLVCRLTEAGRQAATEL
ncbi:hypothetical protein [Reyranella sp.]|uniref:hypothetical protein n=1 Tax=Reyranella sp. TaxID=1929291 RepID=UPI0025F0BE4C|nr:hypothetical protein [Reyranella sp.]